LVTTPDPELENTTMTKPSIALADLLEKGADADLLRQMIQHVAQRMMEMDAEGICAAAYGELSMGIQIRLIPEKYAV
jgi:hypothetical protein